MSIGFEVNFDGIVGPTHNYAGLAHGNLASQRWKGTVANPRAAALEGLQKMKLLADLGVLQAVLPPAPRPDVDVLRRLGFIGSDAQVVEQAHRTDPALLAACYSSSAMWAANAATVSPSADTADRRVHITPANLVSQLHRSLEPATAERVLRAIFADATHFEVHRPLPAAAHLSDEGAANHLRLAAAHGDPGVELFIYGRRAQDLAARRPARFPARQTFEASAAIARLHRLDPARSSLLQQDPAAIDAGAFHADVVAVANLNVLLFHTACFGLVETQALTALSRRLGEESGCELFLIGASEEELPLAEAVGSYVFNSQLVSRPDSRMTLIAPAECLQFPAARRYIDRVLAEAAPVSDVRYVDVRQSMQNGGGPACLRLRVVLTEQELSRIHPGVRLTDRLYGDLVGWVEKWYRDRLAPADLADPQLLNESRGARDELMRMLGL